MGMFLRKLWLRVKFCKVCVNLGHIDCEVRMALFFLNLSKHANIGFEFSKTTNYNLKNKVMSRIKIYLCILLLLLFNNIVAQVTIGSGIAPAKGALLDLKQNDQKNNSTKGVLFPRVVLSDENELYPMFGNKDNEFPEYTEDKNGLNRMKIEHKGLIVYNLSNEDNFNEGLYIWNGIEWQSLVKKAVQPPSINELISEQAKLFPGKFEKDSIYEGGVLTIPYIGGNGMNYLEHTYTANGMTFELIAGSLNVGQGLLYFRVSGTPSAESIELEINFGGQKSIVHLESESDVEIKSIEYVRNRVDVVHERKDNEKNTVTTLGNLQIRYSGRDGGVSEIDFIEFRTLENTHITYQYTKHGEGGNFLYRYNQIQSVGKWLDFGYGLFDNKDVSNTLKDINLLNRDIAVATFILHNTREVYRLTINANARISAYSSKDGDIIDEVPARISLFLERLE